MELHQNDLLLETKITNNNDTSLTPLLAYTSSNVAHKNVVLYY